MTSAVNSTNQQANQLNPEFASDTLDKESLVDIDIFTKAKSNAQAAPAGPQNNQNNQYSEYHDYHDYRMLQVSHRGTVYPLQSVHHIIAPHGVLFVKQAILEYFEMFLEPQEIIEMGKYLQISPGQVAPLSEIQDSLKAREYFNEQARKKKEFEEERLKSKFQHAAEAHQKFFVLSTHNQQEVVLVPFPKAMLSETVQEKMNQGTIDVSTLEAIFLQLNKPDTLVPATEYINFDVLRIVYQHIIQEEQSRLEKISAYKDHRDAVVTELKCFAVNQWTIEACKNTIMFYDQPIEK